MFLLAGLFVKVRLSLLSLRWSVAVLGGLLASPTVFVSLLFATGGVFVFTGLFVYK